jgi:hypothetical protein
MALFYLVIPFWCQLVLILHRFRRQIHKKASSRVPSIICSSVSADCAASPRRLINVSLCRLAAVYPLYPAGGRAASADPPVPAQAGAHTGPVQYHPRLTPAQATPPPSPAYFSSKN